MSDLIDRQAAIDALHMHLMYRMGTDSNKKRLDDWINGVPSVQPEPSTEIQEILDYLDTTLHPIVSPDNWYVYAELHDMISRLPSVQPDRMKLVQQAVNTIMSTSRSYSIRDRAFRNAARLVQCAIDGEAPDFEQIPEGDEMPSEPKWIPCSERLPEENGEYLVTRESKGIYKYVDIVKKTNTSGDIASDIVAWMPLPEPYREEVN